MPASIHRAPFRRRFLRTMAEARHASEIRFSPLRDAVVNVRLSADERTKRHRCRQSIPCKSAAQWPTISSRAMKRCSDSKSPADEPFRSLRLCFAGSCREANLVCKHPPAVSGARNGHTDRSSRASLRTGGIGGVARANLTTIDPLEVARSLGATPAPSVPASTVRYPRRAYGPSCRFGPGRQGR